MRPRKRGIPVEQLPGGDKHGPGHHAKLAGHMKTAFMLDKTENILADTFCFGKIVSSPLQRRRLEHQGTAASVTGNDAFLKRPGISVMPLHDFTDDDVGHRQKSRNRKMEPDLDLLAGVKHGALSPFGGQLARSPRQPDAADAKHDQIQHDDADHDKQHQGRLAP